MFVGPPAEAIERARLQVGGEGARQGAGVPVVPGYSGEDQRASVLRREAGAIGYPLLIKPVAGGGGKGMRRVAHSAQLAETPRALAARGQQQLRRWSRDARALHHPARHIEVQLLADSHGHAVHLFERDCSVQRRHQKMLEEAPASHLSSERRAAMASAAVGARARRRLCQCRHGGVPGRPPTARSISSRSIPGCRSSIRVTELITGLDLVEWQLRIAAGRGAADQSTAAAGSRPRDRGAPVAPRTRHAISCPTSAVSARCCCRRVKGCASTRESARAMRSRRTTTRCC